LLDSSSCTSPFQTVNKRSTPSHQSHASSPRRASQGEPLAGTPAPPSDKPVLSRLRRDSRRRRSARSARIHHLRPAGPTTSISGARSRPNLPIGPFIALGLRRLNSRRAPSADRRPPTPREPQSPQRSLNGLSGRPSGAARQPTPRRPT